MQPLLLLTSSHPRASSTPPAGGSSSLAAAGDPRPELFASICSGEDAVGLSAVAGAGKPNAELLPSLCASEEECPRQVDMLLGDEDICRGPKRAARGTERGAEGVAEGGAEGAEAHMGLPPMMLDEEVCASLDWCTTGVNRLPCCMDADFPLACAVSLSQCVVTDKTWGSGMCPGGARAGLLAVWLCSSLLIMAMSSGVLVCVEVEESRCRLGASPAAGLFAGTQPARNPQRWQELQQQ